MPDGAWASQSCPNARKRDTRSSMVAGGERDNATVAQDRNSCVTFATMPRSGEPRRSSSVTLLMWNHHSQKCGVWATCARKDRLSRLKPGRVVTRSSCLMKSKSLVSAAGASTSSHQRLEVEPVTVETPRGFSNCPLPLACGGIDLQQRRK